MKTMHAAVLVSAMATIAGCASGRGVSSARGDYGHNCAPGGGNRVTIDIEKGAGGYSLHPKECRVDGNTRITWVGVLDDMHAFTIDFGDDTPDKEGRIKFKSFQDQLGTRYMTASIKARPHKKDGDNSYDYTITIDGAPIDPMIIIDP